MVDHMSSNPVAVGREAELTDAEETEEQQAAITDEEKSSARKELEDALRGLKDGSVSEAAAAELIERLVDVRIAQSAGLEATIKSVVAHLTEAPTNWHQAVVFFVATSELEDEAMKAYVPAMFATSVLMTVVQCMTAMAVFISTILPSCRTSDQCPAGLYCQIGFSYRCQFCGSNAPLIMQFDVDGIGTYNQVFDENFRGYNHSTVAAVCADPWVNSCPNVCPEGTAKDVGDRMGRNCDTLCNDFAAEGSMDMLGVAPPRDELRLGFNNMGNWDLGYSTTRILEWCNYCVHDVTGDVDPLTQWGLLEANVESMGTPDWVAYMFASFIVSFQVVGELKDIQLCNLAMEHAGSAISPRWLFGLQFVGFMRRWVFLTLLTCSVPMLVVYRGGDALQICFNTVAILFMTEIDNICYSFALGERVRARVEEAGHVELTTREAKALMRMKVVHVATIVATCLAAVRLAGSSLSANIGNNPAILFMIAVVLVPLGYMFASIAEAYGSGWSSGEVAKHCCKMFGLRLLSGLVMMVMGGLSAMGGGGGNMFAEK
jgi:hypothetical protein